MMDDFCLKVGVGRLDQSSFPNSTWYSSQHPPGTIDPITGLDSQAAAASAMQQQPPGLHHHHHHPHHGVGEPGAEAVDPRNLGLPPMVPPPPPPGNKMMADFFNELELLVHKYNVRAHEEIGLPLPENVKIKVNMEEADVGKKRKRSRKDPNAPKKPKTTYFLFMDDARNRMVPYIKRHIPDVLLKDITKVAAAIWRDDVTNEEKQRYVDLYDKLKKKFIDDSRAFKERKEHAYAPMQSPAPPYGTMMDLNAPVSHQGYVPVMDVPGVDPDEESDSDQSGPKKKKKKNKKKKPQGFMH